MNYIFKNIVKHSFSNACVLLRLVIRFFGKALGEEGGEIRSIFGENILNTAWFIHKNPNINAQEIAIKLSVTKHTVENYLSKLKEAKYIERIGSDKTGHWRVIKK